MNAIVPHLGASVSPGALVTYMFKLTPVRVVMIAGEPWFVVNDACRALSLANPRTSMEKIDDDAKGVHSMDTPGGRQEMAIISEGGLYTLIMRCRDATTPETASWRFRRWVTNEVLPQIRKTGSYAVVPVDPMALLQDPNTLLALLGSYATKTQVLETANKAMTIDLACATAVIEHQEPIVEAYGEIVDADGSLCITDAAKSIGIHRSALSAHMRDKDRKVPWMYGRPGIDEVAYQPRLDRGELVHKLVPIRRSSGDIEARPQVRVTPRGLFLLSMEIAQKERDRRKAAGEFDL